MLNAVRRARTPLLFLILLLCLQIGAGVGLWPSYQDIFSAISKWLAGRGALAVFAVSLVENIAILNTYFPGAIAILGAMAATSGDPALALKVWLAITMGAAAGQTASFYIGRQVQRVKTNVTSLAMLTAYWHPFPGSLVSFTAGRSGSKEIDFFPRAGAILLFWNVFWGAAMYLFGNFIASENSLAFIVGVLVVWAGYAVFVGSRRSSG